MALDEEKLNRFTETALADLKGGMVMLMAHLGDRLGLFRALAGEPKTSAQLAEATELQERYVREWLSSVTCAGYVEYDPETKRFSLPEEHAQVLVEETSPVFFGGMYHQIPAIWQIMPTLMEKFRNGGGVPLDEYDRRWWDGMERFTNTWFENFLLQEWVPKANDIQGKLQRGAHVADVGCGRGHALIKLATTYPSITGVGYDLSETNLEGARRLAKEAGVDDRISFRKQDVHEGLTGQYDVIVTFDAAHDLKDPAQAFRVIHDALAPGGAYLLLEFRVGDHLEDNLGPLGAMFYAWSVTYCMTTSLAMDGKGLGTCGLSETVVRKMAGDAGFGNIEVVPFDNPFNKIYVAEKQAA